MPRRGEDCVVGKYFETGDFVLSDAYISVIEAIKFSAYELGKRPVLTWLSAEEFEKNPRAVTQLSKYDGVLIPGGFGKRGVEGKIAAIKYAREKKDSLFWPLLRHAAHGDRIRAACCRGKRSNNT